MRSAHRTTTSGRAQPLVPLGEGTQLPPARQKSSRPTAAQRQQPPSRRDRAKLRGPETGVVAKRAGAKEASPGHHHPAKVEKSLPSTRKTSRSSQARAEGQWPKTLQGLARMIRTRFPYEKTTPGSHAADGLGAAMLAGPTKRFAALAKDAPSQALSAPYWSGEHREWIMGMVLRQTLAPALRLFVEVAATKESSQPFDFRVGTDRSAAPRQEVESQRQFMTGAEISRMYRRATEADPDLQAARAEANRWSEKASEAAKRGDGSTLLLAQQENGRAYERILAALKKHDWMKVEGGVPTSNREYKQWYQAPANPASSAHPAPVSPSQAERLNAVGNALDQLLLRQAADPKGFEVELRRTIENPSLFLKSLRTGGIGYWSGSSLNREVDGFDLERLAKVPTTSGASEWNPTAGRLAELARAIERYCAADGSRAIWQTATPHHIEADRHFRPEAYRKQS